MLAMTPDVPATRRINVTVKKKDTINTIANRYRVTIAQIKEWNRLHQDKLASGQRLELHVPNRIASKSRNSRDHKQASRTTHSKVLIAAKSKDKRNKITVASARMDKVAIK
jgi:membrane-bound lytic murein transglycosylase D